MKHSDHQNCPQCGARLDDGVETCDLCGASVDVETEEEREVPAVPVSSEDVERPSERGVFCNQCGWNNPSGARFCSVCGSKLQEIPAGAGIPEKIRIAETTPREKIRQGIPGGSHERPGSSRYVSIIITSGVLLVIALFLITEVSKKAPGSTSALVPPTAASAPGGTPDRSVIDEHEAIPLSPEVAEQAEAVEAEIANLTGEEKVEKQRELVDLFVRVGRLDRAAVEQEKIAQALDSPEAWTAAGNLYFDWMESIQGAHKSEVALLAIAAYKKVLEKEPDNLNVRSDMAWAYQYDPQNAMEAINQTNIVLEKNPDHLQANLNKGIFLIQINRMEEAVTYFEKVKEISGEGTPEYERADAAIRAIKDMQSRSAS